MVGLGSAERIELQRAVQGFLARSADEATVRGQMLEDDGFDLQSWRGLARDLDVLGMRAPSALGGADAQLVDQLPVMVELGRSLACVPYLSTAVLSCAALMRSGDEAAAAELLPAVARGDLVLALAVGEQSSSWDQEDVVTSALPEGDGYKVSGSKPNVLDAQNADEVLVAARTEAGVSLLRVEARGPGVRIEPVRPVDRTRRLADVHLDEAPGKLVGHPGGVWPALEAARDEGACALAAEALGGMQKLREITVEHAKTRMQFGAPIGSFQAVKHQVADMLTLERAVERALDVFAWVSESPADGTLVAAALHAYCADAYVAVAQMAIQVFGGIGFTEEHVAHLYLKRARLDRVLLGQPVQHRERAAALLGT